MSRVEEAALDVADELDALGPMWRATIARNEPGVERRPRVVRFLLGLAALAAAGNDLRLDAAAALRELEAAAVGMTSAERREIVTTVYSAEAPLPPEWSGYLTAIARLLAAAEDETSCRPRGS